MRKLLKMLPLFVLMVLAKNVMGQIVSAGAGDWSNPLTWVGNVPPTSADNVSIGHAVNIDNGTAASANLVFTAGGSINFTTSTSVLSIYGNATFGNGVTNISGWTTGAKLVFTGTATQTWTTGASSRFDFVEINKTAGTVSQATGAAIQIGTNLSVVGGGTFTIGSGTDIEGVQFADGTTATNPSIFVGTGSTFNIDAASASFVRSGTTGTAAIGTVTINGTMNLGTTSGNGFQFGAVTVGDGTNAAVLNISTNMGSNGLYNFASLTVNNNATFNMNATSMAASTIAGDILGAGTVVFAVGSSSNHPAIDRSYGGNLIVGVATKSWTTAAPRTIGGSLTLNNASVLTTTLASGKLTINGDLNIAGTSRLSWASGNIDLGGNLLVSSTNSVVALYPQSATSVLTCTGLNKSFTVQNGALVRCVSTGTTPITTQYPGFNTVDFQSGSTIDYFKTSASAISIQDTYNGNNISYSKILISHAASVGGLMAVTINNPVINSSLSIAQGSGTAGQTFTQTVTFANTSALTIPSLTATSSNGNGTLAQNIVLGAQPVIVTGNVSLTDAASTSTATSCVLTINAGSLTIGGSLTVGTTGTTTPFNTPYILLNDPASVLTVTGATTLRSLEQTNGAIKFTNSSQVVTFNGSCTTANGNSGAEVFNFNGTNATINFNNNFTDGAAGSTFFVTGTEVPTINFNNGTLAVPLTSTSAGLRGSVTINGYRQITGSNFRTSNASTAAYSMTINGTLDLVANGSTATNTGGGTNTLNGTGTIKLTGDYGTKVTGYSTNNFQTTGTLHLNGTTNQSLPAGTYQNVIADNTVSVSLSGNATINGALTISKGSLITGANNLTLGASASATIGSAGTLSITGGTTDFASRPVTIQSGSSNTGRIATVTGDNITTGLINATAVTQERYFAGGAATGTPPTPGVRGFRFIAHPFNSNPLLNTLVAGGLSITGDGGATNGFTNNPNSGATNSPSAFSYNPAATGAGTGSPDLGWTAYTNANTETWNKMQGIRVLFRGTNTQGLDGNNVYAVNPLTLSLTGAVNTGAQNFALPATTNVTDPKWSLVGNPYPSQIDVQTLLRNKYNTPTPAAGNIGAAAYVFNPTKSGTLRGGYDMIDISAAGSYILPTCGVVLVQNTIATTHNIPFAETDKSTGTPTLNFRTTSTNNALVLTMKDANGVELDNTYIRLNNNAANTFENRDGGKMLNDYSIYTLTPDNTLLAIDSRPEPIVESIIPMGVKSATAQSFVLKATELALPIRIEAYLKDKFLNVATPLSLGTEYSFSVDPSNAATLGNNRFEIVMRNNNALPATFLNVTAAQKNAGIEVSWTTANETNMSNYEVEESTDGNNFSKAISVAANNTTTNIYNWLDASIINGDNYYRIKAIEKNGTAKYSNVVKVKIGGKGAGFTVYPNPVKGGVVSLQMSNVEKGIYTVKIFNNIGQELAAKAINHNGGSATQTIDLGKGIASGTYNMQITNGTTTVITKTVIVE